MKPIKKVRFLFHATLALVLCAGFASCRHEAGQTTDTTSAETSLTDPASEAPTEPATHPIEPDDETESPAPETIAATEPVTERETYKPYADAENAKTINLAGNLANTVTSYYTSARKAYIIENTNARLTYILSDVNAPKLIGSLTTKDDVPYLTDTVDTFITLASGKTYYASDTKGRVNLYDQGYYYYDVHILDQYFTDADSVVSSIDVDPKSARSANGVTLPKRAESDGSYKFVVKDPTDPYFCYSLNHDTSEVDAVLITMATTKSSSADFFYIAGSKTGYNAQQRINFSLANDGEFHTYCVMISHGTDFTGSLTGLRLDVGTVAKEEVFIKDIRLVKLRDDIPQMNIDRNFVVYSDKINDISRFLADADVTDIAAMGTELRIKADTVQKLIVSDCGGLHTDLSDVDWQTAEYIGFDIKNAGIFGYILLAHQTSGTLSVELTDGEYILRQSYTPNNGTVKKGDEVFVGHRLYTDTNHDFDAFIFAADCERNPLTDIRVISSSADASYNGYDALRGVYEFILAPGGGFAYEYNNPNIQHTVTFEIDGDAKDRPIYIMAHVKDGSLECAAVLDAYNRMLPIRVEVSKNFAHDGEELYYTYNDSIQYGYAMYPMVVEAGNTERMTVCHLYERWGQFRVKQLSSIRFHQAYYHMSTGVTETNCIAFYNNGNRLPDHRAMSQAYWGDVYFSALDENGTPVGQKTVYSEQPQHENNGSHTFLQYVTVEGEHVGTESVYHHIDSAGPTYMDLTMYYVSTDGKIDVSLRHMEMPQYDENRGYYEIDYRVRDTIRIADFKNDFEIYALTTNQSRGYLNLGYLNEQNKPVIVPANNRATAVSYTLGSDYPYVSYFGMTDPDPLKYDRNDIYSNVSFLIKDSDIVIGGEKYEGPFIITEVNSIIRLTLDLGEVTLQPGDHIHVNLILMPWGDNNSSDDENVRLVRENTLLHPIVMTSETDIVVEDVWMPKIRSANGSSATFTVSGGCDNTERVGFASEGYTKYKTTYDRDYNITVRVYGFRTFGTLGLYEQIDGEWVPVDYASDWGYDGYAVLYDEDNTFSFSFNICMNEAKDRIFRVVVN